MNRHLPQYLVWSTNFCNRDPSTLIRRPHHFFDEITLPYRIINRISLTCSPSGSISAGINLRLDHSDRETDLSADLRPAPVQYRACEVFDQRLVKVGMRRARFNSFARRGHNPNLAAIERRRMDRTRATINV